MHSCIVKAVFVSRIIMTILVSNCIFDNLLFLGLPKATTDGHRHI